MGADIETKESGGVLYLFTVVSAVDGIFRTVARESEGEGNAKHHESAGMD